MRHSASISKFEWFEQLWIVMMVSCFQEIFLERLFRTYLWSLGISMSSSTLTASWLVIFVSVSLVELYFQLVYLNQNSEVIPNFPLYEGRKGRWYSWWCCIGKKFWCVYLSFVNKHCLQNNCLNKIWDDWHCNSFSSVDSYNSFITYSCK